MSFLARTALLVLGTAVFCMSGNELSAAFAEESKDVFINAISVYTSCDDIIDTVSVVKVDVHLAADIICEEPKASVVVLGAAGYCICRALVDY